MFRIVSIDISGIPEANKLLRAYADAVSDTTISARNTDAKQRKLESYIGRKIGAKIVSGKIGKAESADYLLPANSSLIKALYQDAISEENVPVEFKGSTKLGVTIGQITIGGRQQELYTPGTIDPFTATSVKQKILGKRLGSKPGYLVDLDPNLKEAADKSTYIFKNYLDKDPRLKQLFYAKASTMLLGSTYELNDSSGSRLIGLKIPKNYFNPTFFKATIVGKAIVVSIKDSFQNAFIRELNESYLDVEKAKKGYKKSFKVGDKTYKIDYLPVLKGEELFKLEITNSIKVRPVDTFILRTPVVKEKTNQQPKPQQFISNAQWTILTQQRLGSSMLTFGDPEPPEIKERSGRFRRSVQVTANYRTKLLQYTYNPLYRSLEHYGYHPELQVERAIREVAQQLYAREFSIVRRGGLA